MHSRLAAVPVHRCVGAGIAAGRPLCEPASAAQWRFNKVTAVVAVVAVFNKVTAVVRRYQARGASGVRVAHG